MPQAQHGRVLGQGGVRICLLGSHRERCPALRLRQPRACLSIIGESVGRLIARPRQRNSCGITAGLLAFRAEPDGILPRLIGDRSIGETELLALVDVDRTRQDVRDECE